MGMVRGHGTKARVAAAALLFLAATGGRARGQDEPVRVSLAVGEVYRPCLSGKVLCPLSAPICDDVSVVDAVDTPDGLGFKGLKAGTTDCSAASGGGEGFRTLFRFEVR